jgi:cell division protein FtsW
MPRDLDAALILLWVMAMTVGVVMVASAVTPLAGDGALGQVVLRHGAYLAAGVVVFGVVAVLPLKVWLATHQLVLVVALLLCALVLVPGIGHLVNGSRRWISFGVASVQAAEIAKFAVVVYLAGYLTRHHDELAEDTVALARPLVMVGLLCGLILVQPDFGSVVVITAVAVGMLFIAGARLRDFIAIVTLGAGLLAVLSALQPYRMQRLAAFLDPWAEAYGSGYQLTQALIAFGRGEWFGLGLGEGVQKLFYLPEAHNDFIFAVIGEELGVVGAVAVLLVLTALVLRILRLASLGLRDGRHLAGYLGYGAGLLIGLQGLINVGVNTGMLPTKGLTLPFVSYGGNSLLVCCALVGLVVRAQLEAHPQRVGGRSV